MRGYQQIRNKHTHTTQTHRIDEISVRTRDDDEQQFFIFFALLLNATMALALCHRTLRVACAGNGAPWVLVCTREYVLMLCCGAVASDVARHTHTRIHEHKHAHIHTEYSQPPASEETRTHARALAQFKDDDSDARWPRKPTTQQQGGVRVCACMYVLYVRVVCSCRSSRKSVRTDTRTHKRTSTHRRI